MVVRCNFPKCNKNSRDDKDHAFFKLPKDPVICNKWVEFAGWKNPQDFYRLCEDHFHPECIWKRHPRVLLIKNAVPTISSRTKLRENTNLTYNTRSDMHCFVRGCPNNSVKTKQPGVSFHSIPKRLSSQWLPAIGRDPNTFIIQQRICSEHFKDDDFEISGFHKKLKANVTPTLNLPLDLPGSEIIVDSMSPTDMPVENLNESQQSEIITIELETEETDDVFPVEETEEPIPLSPPIMMSDSDAVSSDEEAISVCSTSSVDSEPVENGNLTERQASDTSNVQLLKTTNFSPGMASSSDNSSTERLYINPLHYLKRLKQEQERVTLFKNKYKNVLKTSNRRKKKILYLKTVLNDLKKKIKQSTDASKPD